MKVEMNIMLRSVLLASAASASLLAAPTFAQAQTAGDGVDVGEIVVTGSRIRRDTFSAPQPISVIGGEAIRDSGQTQISDVLFEQPTLNANTNSQSSSGNLFLAGQAKADIRGLGAARTLVLMDGRRLPYSDGSSSGVDLNTVPSLMVDRIETIAGGASAVYGSDAIAGVVNFIMKKEQQGLEVDLTAGMTQEGDGEEYRAGFNWGTKLFDDRLNILIGGEYASQDKIMQRDRDWGNPGIRRDTRVTPQPIVLQSRANTSPYATFQLIGGALGTARAVTRDVRDNGQSIVRLSAACSTATVQPDCQDPSLFYSGAAYNALQGKSNRAILRTYVDYKITDNWNIFTDLSYVKGSGYGIFQPAFSSAAGGGTMPVVLRGDNAYLNGAGSTAAALRAEWLAAGKTLTQAQTAQVGKFWEEFGGRDVKTEREQLRYVLGMNGDFETFGRKVNWDGYVQHAKLDGKTNSYGVPNVARVQQATDAVVLNGQVVCRDAGARAAGCVPWDLVNGASRDAILWTNGVAHTEYTIKQTVGALNFSTELFDLPAGPVAVAFGAEYRKESSFFEQDPLSASGALFFNAVGNIGGSFDVREGYGEIRIPILKDVPFAQELTFEAAGRVADYSTIGGTDQHRFVLNWSPVKDIRFRATEGTAVRAPNIVELYSPQGRNFTTAAVDPCDKDVFRGATAAQQAARRVTCAAAIPGYNPTTFVSNIGTGRSSLALLQGGNPNLGPETAHTYQYGVVVQPRWIPGLQVSADFFKINLADRVGTIPINTLFAALCYDDASQPVSSNQFCRLIQRDATGTGGGAVPGGVIQVELTNQNVAAQKVEGWDYSVAYGFQTEDLFGKDFGRFDMRVDATWTYRVALQGLPGQAYTQLANTVNNAFPEWKGNGTIRWSYDKYTFSWSTIYYGSAIASNATAVGTLDPYYTGDYFRHDIRASYKLNDDMTFRAGVVNLFNRNPPALPETFAGTGAGSSQYDNAGRYFFIGANLNF